MPGISIYTMGLRAAAFLTAGIARVSFWKFLVTDAAAALVGVPFSFALAYFFADQVDAIVADMHRAERWLALSGVLVVAVVLGVMARRWTRRVEKGAGESRDGDSHVGGPVRMSSARTKP